MAEIPPPDRPDLTSGQQRRLDAWRAERDLPAAHPLPMDDEPVDEAPRTVRGTLRPSDVDIE